MSHLPFHPAPGLGDLMPGSFVVPSNPIRNDGTPLVPSVQAAQGGQVAYRPKIGDLLPGSFPVPQNPIVRNLSGGMAGLGCGDCGGNAYGRSYGGAWHSNGLQGLGMDMSMEGVTSWLQAPLVAGIPGWGVVAGAIVAYMLFSPGGSEYRAARKDLDRQHRGYRRAAGRIAA